MTKSSQLLSRLGAGAAIVLSLLLAFGIDAAWQERGERREEIRLLSALRDEFMVNRDRVSEIMAFHSDLRSTAKALLEAAADPASDIPADSVDKLIGDVTWWGGFIGFESAALDAVILGGKLDLIENEAVRRLLTAWRREVEATARQEAQSFTPVGTGTSRSRLPVGSVLVSRFSAQP